MMHTPRIALFTALILVFASAAFAKETLAPAPGPRHALVADGQPAATIVLPAAPDEMESYAAAELQKYVKEISGATLPIIKEPQQPEGYGVWLGQTKAAQAAGFKLDKAALGRDGYAARADVDGMIVVGRCPIGTLFGVYDIIEREFGVRWVVPDERHEILQQGWLTKDGNRVWDRRKVWADAEMIGTVIPKSENLSVGTFRRDFRPSFEFRWVREGQWPLHNRMNVQATTSDGRPVGVNWKWHFHTHTSELIKPEKYFKDHPEWFALVGGKRQGYTDPSGLGHNCQLCTTNPELIEEMARRIIEVIEADPTIEVISLGASDGGGFCECENCKALDIESRPRVGRLSNRAAVFNNEVARRVGKRFPDVLIKVGAYVYYYLPPDIKNFRVEPNILVQICHNSSPYQPLIGEAKGIQHADVIRQWAAMADNLGVYEAYALAACGRFRILRPMMHTMRHDIPWYRDAGVKAFYTQNVQQPWYQCPLNHYVAAKLAWNADLDVDWLIDDYCQKFFADAAEPMRDYLLGLEQAMLRWEKSGHGGGNPGFAGVAFDRPTRDHLMSFLLKARDAAGSDVIQRRVAAVRRGFDEFEESLLSGYIKEELDRQAEKDRLKEEKKRKAKLRKAKEKSTDEEPDPYLTQTDDKAKRDKKKTDKLYVMRMEI